jgi:hypothetical protein
VSRKALEAILYLLRVAGVSLISKDVAMRFTNIARLMLLDMTSYIIAEPTKLLLALAYLQNLRTAARTGKLADVVNISNAMQAYYLDATSGVSSAFSDVAKNNYLNVLLFLCKNWTPYLVTSCAKLLAVAQIFIDFG